MRGKAWLLGLVTLVLSAVLGLSTCSSDDDRVQQAATSAPPATASILDLSKVVPQVSPSTTPSMPATGFVSHDPGPADVSTLEAGKQFFARPNFAHFLQCGRPCWLPLYTSAKLETGKAVTTEFPYERFAGNAGDAVLVVC